MQATPTAVNARRASASINSALLQASIVTDTERRLREQEEKLREQEEKLREQEEQLQAQKDVIDRLLAFVPKRAIELSEPRLTDIVTVVARAASALLAGRSPIISCQPESDPESEACHRIEITFAIQADEDVMAIAEIVLKMHEEIATRLSVEDFQSISILVEPYVAS